MITYKGRQIPETFEEIVNPLHTALIVHEMRNDLRDIGSFDKDGNTIHIDFDSIVAPISRLLTAARDKNARVIYAGYIRGKRPDARRAPTWGLLTGGSLLAEAVRKLPSP